MYSQAVEKLILRARARLNFEIKEYIESKNLLGLRPVTTTIKFFPWFLNSSGQLKARIRFHVLYINYKVKIYDYIFLYEVRSGIDSMDVETGDFIEDHSYSFWTLYASKLISSTPADADALLFSDELYSATGNETNFHNQ